MSDPLHIGLVGAGPWACMVTGPLLHAGPETKLAGVWSRTEANAAEVAAQLDVPVFADVDGLFDACEAVAIAVAPSAQPEFAVRAAKAGKTLLLEKPLGDDLAGAEAIADAVEAAGVGALLMLTNRFNPALADFLTVAHQTMPFGGRGCFISGAFLGGPFAYGWRLERGAVLDVGPHLLDLLDAALGPIVDVHAVGDPLGWVSITCTHESGATSEASLCCAAATDSRTEVEVFGPRGTAKYDGREIDYTALATNLRQSVVAVAGGASHPASVARGLHLQRLITDIESQLQH